MGADDPSRHTLYSGQTQLLTPAGVLPLVFEIEADTLQEALDKFPEGVKGALEQAAAQGAGKVTSLAPQFAASAAVA